MQMTREDAWALVTEWTASESLRKHMLAVEAAVRGYARQFGEDEEAWGITALLHDFDYERFPDQENHPFRGVEELQRRGCPEWLTRAILSHAEYSGVATGIEARTHPLRLRRDVRVRDGRGARPAQQEHPRSRGGVRDEADEGQGLRARRQSR